jgi:hypothetical protein
MKKTLLFLVFFLIFLNIKSQDFSKVKLRNPLSNMILIGNFCELRATHFHAGLDIRSPIGTKIYSPEDGYISRIKVSGYGYGNGLYITHYNGYKTVYGHLSNYTPQVKDYIKRLQFEKKVFAIDTLLDSTIFPIKKGEVIGYVGNTGRSYGPHLHFEVRSINDEPYNPLLFGFSYNDTKAPEIKTIAVYPASDYSTINGQKNSITFTSNTTEINVSGPIYFGVEAYDYTNDVSNRMAIYSIKLFVDEKLIFHSAFDIFSYETGRDYRSFVDYERRLTTDMRIHRCYVEPNNELLVYKTVENQGIVNFNDNLLHNIKFVIGDFKGNISTFNFSIKNNKLSNKKSITKDSTNFFKYSDSTVFKQPGIRIIFPKKSFFDNIFFEFNILEGNKYSPSYLIHKEFIPLKNSFIISIVNTSVPSKYKDKIVLIRKTFENKYESYLTVSDGIYSTSLVNVFGTFFLDVDTILPVIKPKNFKNNTNVTDNSNLQFTISDNLTGVNEFWLYINGKWSLIEFDAKNNLLTYTFDENTKSGINTLKLILTDGVGNVAIFETEFFR